MSRTSLASVQNCPCCGRPLGRPRPTVRSADSGPSVDTSKLSDAELFKHYKRTAPVEDLRFFLRHARLSPELQASGDALLAAGCRDTGGTLSRSDWYRRLTALQDRWRRTTEATALPNAAEFQVEIVGGQ